MRTRLFLAVLGAGLLSSAAIADSADFSRYEIILERKPFGDTSTASAQVLTAEQVQGAFIKDFRLCGITESTDGQLSVGLVNVKVAPPASFILRVGETTDDGITLVDADYEAGKALLRKGNDEYWIAMGNELIVSSAAGTPSVSSGSSSSSSVPRMSYADRLRQRREALQKPPQAPPKLDGEALRKSLEEYQMELIRAGGEKGPPLPIPLTPAMDEQLVKEGVLPPESQ